MDVVGIILRKVAEELQFESVSISASLKMLLCIPSTDILKVIMLL